MTSKVKLPPQLQAVEDLLLWRHAAVSAAALAGVTMVYFVLEVSSTPLVTWCANMGLVAVVAAALWATAAKFAHLTGPEALLPPVFAAGVDEGVVRAAAERLRLVLNKLLSVVGRLLSGRDLLLNAKAAGALFAIGALGRIASPVGLLYTAILLLFTLPKLYEMRKDDVDKAASLAASHAAKHYETARKQVNDVVAKLTPQKAKRPASATGGPDKTQ